MTSVNRWLILAIVTSALVLIVIDVTVLYTALPRLTHDLGATAAEKLWIIKAYPLVMAGLLPGPGTLGEANINHFACLATQGVGLGAATTAASGMIMLSASTDRAGMAVSVEEVSYEFGGMLGITIPGSLMSAVYTDSLVMPASLGIPDIAYDGLDHKAFVIVISVATAILFATAIIIRVRSVRDPLLPEMTDEQ